MKASQQILGLPVMSVEEGRQIGVVRDLILNPRRGTLDFILVEDSTWYLGAKVLPFSKVLGIGAFALTVEGRSSLEEAASCAGALELLKGGFKLPGVKIITKKGRLIGTAGEYYVSEASGKVLGCDLLPEGAAERTGIIPRSLILTFGSDYLVVEDSADRATVEELAEDTDGSGDIPVAASTPQPPAAAPAPGSQAAGEKDALKHFEEQQRQYLLGKKAAMKITGTGGEVIVEEGEVITEEVIERAKAHDKYIQLTLNVRD